MTAQVAETVLRVAVLLEAGVTPTRAWDHLAKQGDLQASQVVNAVDGGARIDSAIAALAVEPAPEPRRRIRIARVDAVGESVAVTFLLGSGPLLGAELFRPEPAVQKD